MALATMALLLVATRPAAAAPLDRAQLSALVAAPMAVGKPLGEQGVHELLSSGGGLLGYVFTTEPLAPLPGFSGAPIDLLVLLDLEGRFLDVRLVSQNEPIFVSGLGEAPLHKFLEQYRGHSINETLVVGVPYGAGEEASALVTLEGVTKATASVRIAHESILAAARAVAREKMQGVVRAAPARPDPARDEVLQWDDLMRQGLARRFTITNAEIDRRFAGTLFADDDAEARDDPAGHFLDLYVLDLGPPSLARAVLSPESLARLQRFGQLSPHDEPILLIEAGRHGLVSPKFVRNTSPDWISATQDGLPIALRDADLSVDLLPGVPKGRVMVVRTDRRLGFDPARPWDIHVLAVREHGMFRPEIGSETLTFRHETDARFFLRPQPARAPVGPAEAALHARAVDLGVLSAGLLGLFGVLGRRQNWLAARVRLAPLRLGFLVLMIAFVGYWGQGQLSIVTFLGVLRAAFEGASLQFLLYDPFSLLLWVAAILGFVLFGRGLFCGWLCPFGAMQELADRLGRLLRLPQWEVPALWDGRLKALKYLVLATLCGVLFLAPARLEAAAEVEPFKTAISVSFQRAWPYVAYAVLWLALGMIFYKSYCRYLCPLGAVMALGGLLRGRDWIARRAECGSPCQLCNVRCRYGAIKRGGQIKYSECFQCLDCVQIHDDAAQCVPLVLAARQGARKGARAAARPVAARPGVLFTSAGRAGGNP